MPRSQTVGAGAGRGPMNEAPTVVGATPRKAPASLHPPYKSRREDVRLAVLVRQQLVGFRVVDEPLGLGVPGQIRPRLVGDVADQRGGRAAVAELDVAAR